MPILRNIMDIKDFKAGTLRNSAGYKYFLPEKINHSYVWTDETINKLLEEASFKIGELNAFPGLYLIPICLY